jgi:hypothetical protein
MPNIKNLETLRDWLQDGAPHVTFNMDRGLTLTTEVVRNGVGPGDCGTTCCIAGAAVYFVALQVKPDGHVAVDGMSSPEVWTMHSEIEDLEAPWDRVAQIALDWLGLTADGSSWYGHDLFSPRLAPDDCTPQQAAVAVQNIIDGKAPWSHVRRVA